VHSVDRQDVGYVQQLPKPPPPNGSRLIEYKPRSHIFNYGCQERIIFIKQASKHADTHFLWPEKEFSFRDRVNKSY
jgi:hypothetical protein